MNTLNLQHKAAYVKFVTWIYTPESNKHKKPIFNNVINYQKRFDIIKKEQNYTRKCIE